MNISSLVISTLPEHAEMVVESLKNSSLCEYHVHKEGKIVVTIDGESVSDEIKILRELERFENVRSAEMVYSYCEDELSREKEKLELEGKIPDWLNDENAKAEDIVYNGRLKM
jgi:nitrate reductase NapD